MKGTKSIFFVALIAAYGFVFSPDTAFASLLRYQNDSSKDVSGCAGQCAVELGSVVNNLGTTTVFIFYNGTTSVTYLYATYSACLADYVTCDNMASAVYFSLPLNEGVNQVIMPPFSSSTPTKRYWRMDLNGSVDALKGISATVPYYLIEEGTWVDPLGSASFQFQSLESCKFSTFNLGDCLYNLVLPTSDNAISLMTDLKEGVLSKAPFGYGTRVYDIVIGNNATATLPEVMITVPDRLPGGGATLDLTPWTYLGTSGPLQSAEDADGNTYWDIIETGWNTICLAVFGLWILGLILKESQHH